MVELHDKEIGDNEKDRFRISRSFFVALCKRKIGVWNKWVVVYYRLQQTYRKV